MSFVLGRNDFLNRQLAMDIGANLIHFDSRCGAFRSCRLVKLRP
jgi:hypothetical protein